MIRRYFATVILQQPVQLSYNLQLLCHTDSRSQWPNGQGVGLLPLACWDCEFESRRGHGCLSLVSVVCCQVEVSASGWLLVQSSTKCGVSECDGEASIMTRPWTSRGCCAMEKKKAKCHTRTWIHKCWRMSPCLQGRQLFVQNLALNTTDMFGSAFLRTRNTGNNLIRLSHAGNNGIFHKHQVYSLSVQNMVRILFVFHLKHVLKYK
jgi:hypothetical protein